LMGAEAAQKPQVNGSSSSTLGRRGQIKKTPGHWWSK
jgi:phosphatidylinositol glycan class Q protein